MTDSSVERGAADVTDARPGADGESGGGGPPPEREIGWLRAVLSGLAVIVVGFAGAVWAPNAILTKSLALTRGARELLATLLFFAAIVIIAVALRWLQHRKLI